MERIRKTIKQIITTGKTGNDIIIIPDNNAVYNIKISLTQKGDNFGFFDVNDLDGIEGTTLPIIDPYIVSGTSKSRLNELKKHLKTTNFYLQYITSDNISINGVDLSKTNVNSIPKTIVYYIDKIEYTDIISGNTTNTTYKFNGQGFSSSLFVNYPIYKEMSKENVIANPKINNDVFIDRQGLSAFVNNYNLEFISDLYQLTTFVGGNYYNIVKV